MTSVYRTLTLGSLLGLACLPLAASAAKLSVLNDGGTNDVSEIALQSVYFNAGTKRLHVTTAAGNIDCGNESNLTDLPAGQLGLVVDDGGSPKSYALRTTSLPATRQPIQYLLPGQDFEVILKSSVDPSRSVGCKSNDLTNFKLQFDAGRQLSVAEQVYFHLADKTFQIRVNEPVLCHVYNATAPGLKVALRSPAEPDAVVLPGYFQLDYKLGGKLLQAFGDPGDGSRSTQCLDLLGNTVAQGAVVHGDRVFGARFETGDVQANVRVFARPAQAVSGDNVSVVVSAPAFAYEIEVVNLGNGIAGRVQVSEYLPAGVNGSNWSCQRLAAGATAGVPCATPSGNGRLVRFGAGDLASGERLIFNLNRSVANAVEGQTFILGGAAFVSPSAGNTSQESNFTDNSDPVTVSVIGNVPVALQAPTVVAYEDGDSANPQAPTQTSSGIAIPLTFTDGDSATLTVTAVTTNAAAGLPATITPVPTLIGSSGTFTGTLNLPATGKDMNGNVSVTLTVNDGSSTVQRTFSFDVLARNDAPLYTLSTEAIAVPSCSGTCGETLVTDFVTAVAAGPTTALNLDEGAQTTMAVLDGSGRIACANPPSGFFTFDENPTLVSNAGNYNLRFRAGGTAGTVTCSIAIRDSGSPQGVTTKTFTIGYTSPPPTVTGVPSSDVALNEDNGAPVPPDVLLTITDPDGLQAGSPSIASSSPGILGASLLSTANPNEWRVVFTPVADRNGNDIVLTVTATDAAGSTATRTFQADVAAVNDAPAFSLTSNALTVPACTPSAPCDYIVNAFVSALSPGPADEAGQGLELVRSGTNRITCSNAPAGFFGTASAPQIIPGAANFDLVAEGIGSVSGTATCEITVRETVETSSTTTRSFTITYP